MQQAYCTGRVQEGSRRTKALTGQSHEFRVDHVDLETLAFISIREARGRGQGLPEIRKITLAEAQHDIRYKQVIATLINGSHRILKILVQQKFPSLISPKIPA